jgi:[glutamine synthetase] adenylyltransferase / [glutamine synthetase]-adenylyl-L-tyrosine phosphorylase
MVDFDPHLKNSPDPQIATIRLEHLLKDKFVQRYLEKMSNINLQIFINLIAYSNFIYRYFCRHPEFIASLCESYALDRNKFETIRHIDTLRLFKYEELLKITWLDLIDKFSYQVVLDRLSVLADCIIIKVMQIVTNGKKYPTYNNLQIPFCIFAMGKLGANELNYSSDIDLIFVCLDSDGFDGDIHDYQAGVIDHIRQFNKIMQDVTEDGFLYRVDLKLRPWGRSGPLVLSVDETEHYYEASTEAWERFAWLRARIVGGDRKLGEDLLQRLQPFIYLRSLSSDDLNRFVQIKNDMSNNREKSGSWDVKLGKGGIRDIEFFIQMLQIVNAHSHAVLKSQNTLIILDHLVKLGFISREEGRDINDSYLFLRRLENRLQMFDEQQVHQLPDDPKQRIKIACSLGYGPVDKEKTLDIFEKHLTRYCKTAGACFDRILPRES